MNTHTKLEQIADDLRTIIKNDNDGNRLIAEMVEEFSGVTDLLFQAPLAKISELEDEIYALKNPTDEDD